MGKTAIQDATRGTFFFVKPDRVTLIGHDTEHKAADHPLFDERVKRPVDEALVRNILAYGVKHAVTIRKNGVHASGPYKGQDILEVMDGRGRTKATRVAAERADKSGDVAPLLKVELDRSGEDNQVGLMISLNELRSADTAMNRVRKAARILASGRNEAEVANMFGVTTQAIKNWQVVIGLCSAVHKAIDQDLLSMHAAKQLSELSHKDQESKLDEILAAANKGANGANGAVKRPTGEKVRQTINPEAAPKLTRRVVKKLVADEEWIGSLNDDAAAILRFLAGDEKALRKVPGLAIRMRKLTAPKEKAAEQE